MLRRIAGLLILASLWAAAQDIPNPATSGAWIADTAGMLNDADRQRVRSLLKRIYRSTQVQFVVVTVPSGGTRTFATNLFQRWGLGSAQENNGLLLLLSKEERAIEIVTGSGLSGRLPPSELRKSLAAIGQGGNLIEGVKTLGASVKGFDRSQPVPRDALLLAALGTGILALFGVAWFLKQWRSLVLFPVVGRRREEHHYPDGNAAQSEFAKRKEHYFFRHEAYTLAPDYNENARVPLWIATAMLPLFAAALTGFLLALFHFDLEPSPWIAAAITGFLSALPVLALYPPEADGAVPLLRNYGIASVISGALFYNFFDGRFLSDFAFAVYAGPGHVLVVAGLLAGFLLYLLLDRKREPVGFGCATCRNGIVEIPQSELHRYLRNWEPKSRQSGLAHFRGWRCNKCSGKDEAYIVHAVSRDECICEKCSEPAVTTTRQKGGWLASTCLACGAQSRKQLPKQKKAEAGGYGGASSYEGGSYGGSSSSDDDDSSSSYSDYSSDRSYSSDTPSSGGSTDGGGASGSWNND